MSTPGATKTTSPRGDRFCSITGCGRKFLARGWCKTHYYKWYEAEHPRDRTEWRKDYAVRNREKVLAWKRKSSRIYRERNPGYWRENAYQRKFGITVAEYEEMLAAQEGVCAIFGGLPNAPGNRLHVDHCHDSQRVRGLLCGRCNRAIGLLGDDHQLLAKAAAYLGRAL